MQEARQMVAIKPRNPHLDGLATSSTIASWYVKNMIRPQEVIRVLNKAKVRFMLAGAHGIAGWLDEARATQDVDVVVGYRQHQKATRALLAAFPHLQVDDQEVVVRLSDPESGKVVIDVMKANQPLYRQCLKHTQTIQSESETYKIPSLEMALAMKFGPMASVVRADEKKYRDASDFMRMVKTNPNINLVLLAELGDLVYPGGGKEIVELVRKTLAGEKLNL
jgi:hypothetical protein